MNTTAPALLARTIPLVTGQAVQLLPPKRGGPRLASCWTPSGNAASVYLAGDAQSVLAGAGRVPLAAGDSLSLPFLAEIFASGTTGDSVYVLWEDR